MRTHDYVTKGDYTFRLLIARAKHPGEIGILAENFDNRIMTALVTERRDNGTLKILGGGAAVCSPLDTFDPVFGAHLAIARAIAHLPKGTRRRVWEKVHAIEEHRAPARLKSRAEALEQLESLS